MVDSIMMAGEQFAGRVAQYLHDMTLVIVMLIMLCLAVIVLCMAVRKLRRENAHLAREIGWCVAWQTDIESALGTPKSDAKRPTLRPGTEIEWFAQMQALPENSPRRKAYVNRLRRAGYDI